MSEPKPMGPILRRTFGPTSTGLRVLSIAEERRRARPRYPSRLAVRADLDRRLEALGYQSVVTVSRSRTESYRCLAVLPERSA